MLYFAQYSPLKVFNTIENNELISTLNIILSLKLNTPHSIYSILFTKRLDKFIHLLLNNQLNILYKYH